MRLGFRISRILRFILSILFILSPETKGIGLITRASCCGAFCPATRDRSRRVFSHRRESATHSHDEIRATIVADGRSEIRLPPNFSRSSSNAIEILSKLVHITQSNAAIDETSREGRILIEEIHSLALRACINGGRVLEIQARSASE